MKNFKEYKPVIWLMLILSYLLIITEIIGIYQDWVLPKYLVYFSRLLVFLVWILCFIDILKNRLFNKTFWILSLFILTPICLPSYLYLREKLMR